MQFNQARVSMFLHRLWLVSSSILSVDPSEVLNLSLGHNGTHFIVSWEEPLRPNGEVSYVLNLSCTDLYQNRNDVILNMKMTVALEYFVEQDSPPYSQCLVVVTSQTGAGQGPERNNSLITAEASKESVIWILRPQGKGTYWFCVWAKFVVVWEQPFTGNIFIWRMSYTCDEQKCQYFTPLIPK